MAQSIRDYEKLAVDIVEAVGGKENIANAARCATRLRLVLKETPKDANKKVSGLTGVITVVENNGQFQVVIGTHVGKVFDKVQTLVDLDQTSAEEAPKGNIVNRVIATMSAVFAPFIYILAAAGLLQGCLIIIKMLAPGFESTGTCEVLSFMSWAPFTFLPIFIAITASKHFKCNTFIAVACCAALVSPDWAAIAARIAGGEAVTFLGIGLAETTYTSSVLPPLFLVLVLSYLERFVEKVIPEVVKSLFVPFVCIVIMVPITILVIGPVSDGLATAIANGYNALYNFAPVVAAAVIGGLWQVVVIFGVHWGVTPMVLANFDMYGQDTFQAYQTMAVVAQMGAAFGVFLKAKKQATKSVALSAGVTGIFGITEPAIYGVTLRFKKPFICACISGAIAAAIASFFNSVYYVYAGLPGVLTIVNAIGKNPTSIVGELIGCAIAVIGSIVLVQIVGFDEGGQAEESEKTTEETVEAMDEVAVSAIAGTKEVKSPLSGKVISLSNIDDPVFSGGAMGNGVAINPSDNKVYAPFNGTVEFIAESKHAVGLKSEDGVELLIHVGMDTVQMNGEGFDVKVKQGDKVKSGELLLTFDREAIEKAGYSLITPVVITNSFEFKQEELCLDEEVSYGKEVINLTAVNA